MILAMVEARRSNICKPRASGDDPDGLGLGLGDLG